jgi:hypothetical protein
MSIIDSAVSHFSNKEIRSIEIPEWGVKLFSKNLTLDDKSRMLSRANGNSTDYLIYAVIFGTTDGEGKPAFTLEDKSSLRNKVDPEIVSRIATFVLESGTKSEEEREKN